MLPAEGLDGVKTVYSKLQHGLRNIQTSADDEFKYENNLKVFTLFIH